jgi:ferredoxin--NADP+ reductase
MTDTFTTPGKLLRVAIVGAGPAGFYAAVELLRNNRHPVAIDMFDRLPTPFGLVRNGVAPDHENIRAVTAFYTKGVESGPVRYRLFGNVELGRDLLLRELRTRYHAVIIAIGAQSDRKLGIPGEELRGVHPASVFVSWYNGHPDFCDARFDLSVDRAVVVGQGNVAIDVCRMLLRTPQELARTDTAEHALAALSGSQLRHITLVGRSGPAQAAFTPTELKELTALHETELVVSDEDRDIDPLTRARYEKGELDPLKAKNLEVVMQDATPAPRAGRRVVHLKFFSSPVELLGDGEKVTGIRVRRNRLVHHEAGYSLEPTDRFETLPCGIVFRSIGYQVMPVEGVPFELDRCRIPNDKGQVLTVTGGPPVAGLYVTGWAKRGPSGIIGTNKPDALETVTRLLHSWEQHELPEPAQGSADIAEQLERTGVPYVTYSDWKLLDQLEIGGGRQQGRPRRKFTDVESMLRAIADAKLGTSGDAVLTGRAGA